MKRQHSQHDNQQLCSEAMDIHDNPHEIICVLRLLTTKGLPNATSEFGNLEPTAEFAANLRLNRRPSRKRFFTGKARSRIIIVFFEEADASATEVGHEKD
jgi:hypothetical protein